MQVPEPEATARAKLRYRCLAGLFGFWREKFRLDTTNQFADGERRDGLDARRYPRYKLEVDICVYPRQSEAVSGYTVDISESGISAMLRDEVPLGEVVRVEFIVDFGKVEVLAMVRQRNAFRYGFQFVETTLSQDIIARTCRHLAVGQSTKDLPRH